MEIIVQHLDFGSLFLFEREILNHVNIIFVRNGNNCTKFKFWVIISIETRNILPRLNIIYVRNGNNCIKFRFWVIISIRTRNIKPRKHHICHKWK